MGSVDTIEMEKLLKSELEIFLKLEESIVEKKKHLIQSDMDNLRKVDIEIEKLSLLINNLESKKVDLLKKSDNCKDFKAFIMNIKDDKTANKIFLLKEKIKNSAINIQKQNKINARLIEHALKLVESSVMIITNALMPESSSYNNLGKKQKGQAETSVSSIIQEA